MLQSLYAMAAQDEDQNRTYAAILRESLNLFGRVEDFIISTTRIALNALQTLDVSGIPHRIPDPDTDEGLKLLADLRDLSDTARVEAEYLEDQTTL